MSMSIEDSETIAEVSELATLLETNAAGAIKRAVRAELERLRDEHDFDQGLREVYARLPKLEPTGLAADKAFFDDLSGETG